MRIPEDESEKNEAVEESPPPILGSWKRLYAAVFVYTFALIGLLYYMTIALNR